jgi:hypothetical protein
MLAPAKKNKSICCSRSTDELQSVRMKIAPSATILSTRRYKDFSQSAIVSVLLIFQDEYSLYASEGTVDSNNQPALKRSTGNWRACFLILGIIFSADKFFQLHN